MQPYKALDENVEIKSQSSGRKYYNILNGTLLCGIFVLLFLIGTVCWSNPEQLEQLGNNIASKKSIVYDCDLQLVESIPVGLNFTPVGPKHLSTFDAWQLLLDNAKNTLDIGSFYWTLRGEDTGLNHSTAQPGEKIFQRLLSNGNASSLQQKLKIQVAQSVPTSVSPNEDTKLLAFYNAAQVVSLNFPKYFGGGVLHTKLWIVDGQHFYLGSANMDWRSLTQVKELGVLAQNCPQLTADLAKIFKIYWYLGTHSAVPDNWPYDYTTEYNVQQPMLVNVSKNSLIHAYISSAPPPLSAHGRTHDLDAILNTINTAIKFVHISVMDYYPLIIYGPNVQYWPYIDNALRKAAVERRVAVKMLISHWQHSDVSESNYLRSLQVLSLIEKHVDIQVRRFIVPADDDQKQIPFARVNHNKYMVTDTTAYIGTSNWSGDYFTDTAGVALVLGDTLASAISIRSDLQAVFERDWTSPYAHEFH